MPLYEYQCDACGHRFERIQKFADPPVDACPQCGERQVRKLLSSPAIQFKGSGWYITDYARKDAGSKESKDTAGAAESKDAPASAKSNESGESKKSGESKESKSSESKETAKPAAGAGSSKSA